MTRIVTHDYTHASANSLFDRIWPGYRLKKLRRAGDTLIAFLVPHTRTAVCPKCGKICYKAHSKQLRSAREAPLMGCQPMAVEFVVKRYKCSCGCTCTNSPEFIAPRAKLTKAAVLFTQQLLRMPSLSISDVAKLTKLSWTTLKKLDKDQLKYCYDQINFNGVQNIAIDEFSVHKNHKYATVVIDNDTCRVLWVGKGKSQRCVQPFFDLLKERGVAQNIKSVACDQNAAYPALVRNNLPNADIVYDLFHVIANWRRDVLIEARKVTQHQVGERVRRELTEQAQKDGIKLDKTQISSAVQKATKAFSGADWALVTPTQGFQQKDKRNYQSQLDMIMRENSLLAALYPIAEALRQLWRQKSQQNAAASLKNLRLLLLQIGRQYKFRPATRFASMLLRRQDGILRAGHYGFTTNRLEGVNNKIKVAKRIAYGFRDLEYFFLKIKGMLPGKTAIPMFERLNGIAIIKGSQWTCDWAESLPTEVL